ncbi:DUF1365 domain-containing protein [Viridibacterium curvum]|uniref:DUF1365 domain-containing protein n=2 Tax=Viridibacterium curvum TaxID=1101404 RepID=A0ABP9QVT2_9RHOO
MHERHAPAVHRFVYRHFTLRLPLSQLAGLRVPLLGINRRGLMAVHERDHGPRDGSPLLPWIRAQLARNGLAEIADGEVILQTLPRLFGYVFNPVSFWFCHDSQGALRAVLAEVSNTFGGHHNYLVAHPDGRVIGPDDEIAARKLFHVSPFLDVQGTYRFRFRERGGFLFVAIDHADDAGETVLSTRMSGRLQPLTGRSLLRAWLSSPLLTFAVIGRIHWQALRLLVKRVPFVGARPSSRPATAPEASSIPVAESST